MKKLFPLVFLLCSLSPAARAQQNICGEADASGTVRCSADNYRVGLGPILYFTRDDDQNVVVDGVVVDGTIVRSMEVESETDGSGTASVTLTGTTIETNTSNPAVRAISFAEGNAVLEVTGNSRIENTAPDAGGIAVLGARRGGPANPANRRATGDLFLTLRAGSEVKARITSRGDSIAAAVLGEHRNFGALTIRSAGAVESVSPGTGYGVAGIMYAGDNRALLDVEINGGTVTSPRVGLFAEHRGTGDVRAVLSSGAITTSATGLLGSGILGRSLNTDQTVSRKVTVLSGGDVITTGASSFGVYGGHQGLGDIDVSLVGGSVTTVGAGVAALHEGVGNAAVTAAAGRIRIMGGTGIYGEHRGTGAVTITVRSAADIITNGDDAWGVRGLISNADSSGALNIDITGGGGGGVETGGERAHAIHGEHQGMGAVTITVRSAADIITNGDDAWGVRGLISNADSSGALNIDITGGRVETRGGIPIGPRGNLLGGNATYAIHGEHQGMGAVTVTVRPAADIITNGNDAWGVRGLISNADSSGALNIDLTGGRVNTRGERAHAVHGEHQGMGAVTIGSAADIITNEEGAWGVRGLIDNLDSSGALNIDLTGGTVETGGDTAHAIYGEHRGMGAVTIGSAAEIITSGQGSLGVQGLIANTDGSAALNIDITGGRVETRGDTAHAIYGEHRGMGAVTIGSAAEVITSGQGSLGVQGLIANTGSSGALNIDITGGTVETRGETSHAVHGEHRGVGAVTIGSAAEASTSGLGSIGVQGLIANTGSREALNIDITGGRVETSGDTAQAIHGEHRGVGAITIRSAAEVIARGQGSIGVSGLIDNANSSAALNIDITGGKVETSGDTTLDGMAHAIHGEHRGLGAVTIGSAADIITSGLGSIGVQGLIDNADSRAALNIDITGGRVETSGETAQAIHGEHRGLGAVTIGSAAEIITSGQGSIGVQGLIDNTGNSAALNIDITGGRVETSADTTPDDATHAIHGEHQGLGAVTIRSAAEVITRGQGSFGVWGFIANTDNSDSAGLNIDITGGRVETSGDETHAVYGTHLGRGFELDIDPVPPPSGQPVPPVPSDAANAGGVTIRSAAEVVTSGRGAHGIVGFLGSEDNVGALNIQLEGSVDASGDAAHAIYGEHLGATVFRPAGLRTATTTVTVNGEATGGTGAGRGVFLATGGAVIVGPEGRLSARSGIAVQSATGALRLSIDGSGFQGFRIGNNVEDIQRIQGSPITSIIRNTEVVGNTTTIEVGGVVLLQGNEELQSNELTGELVHLMYGVTDRSVQLVAEANAPDPMDCGANCWRWLFSDPMPTSRAFALEVLPQALLNLTRPARDWQSGAYEETETGPWFTISGHRGSYEPDSASSHSSYDQRWVRAELGVQGILPRWTREGSKTLAGISAHFLDSSTEDIQGSGARSPIDTSEAGLDTTGTGFGLHLHWQGARGYYVRAEGAGTWYDGQLAATRMRSDYEGFGWSLSLAGGRSLPWARYPGVMLVPHAQLSLAGVQVDRLTAPFAMSVDESHSVRGLLGMRLEKTGQWGEADTLLYGAGGVEYEFDGETAVNAGGAEAMRLAVQPEPLLFALSLGAGLSGQGAWLGIKGYELSFQAGSALSGLSNYEASISADMTLRF